MSDPNREEAKESWPCERSAEDQAEIAECLRQVNARAPQARVAAVRRLGELHAEPQTVLAALQDNNSYVRAAAAGALGRLGRSTPEIVDGLLAAIDDGNDHVCAAAIRTLGSLHVEAAREEILTCLQDSASRVVQAAILALGRLGPAALGERLAGFLGSPDDYVRSAAAQAVGLLGYRPAGPAVLAALQSALVNRQSADYKLIRAYVDALAALEETSAVPLLLDLARHQVGLRSLSVAALTRLAPASAAPKLLPLLADPSSQLRENLVALIRAASYRAALPAIRPLLAEAKAPAKLAALTLVTDWQDLAAVPLVREICYHESNPYLRPAGLRSLVALLGASALPDLLRLAADQNVQVRAAVAACMGSLPDLPASAQVALACLAADEQASVAQAAHDALASHGLDAATITLERSGRTESLAESIDLYPVELMAEAATLRRALECWQAGLPGMLARCAPEEIAAVDQALTTLLSLLP